MRVIIQTVNRRIEKLLDFDGAVSDLVRKVAPGLGEMFASEKWMELYTILIDGRRAGPESRAGETVSILPLITGG